MNGGSERWVRRAERDMQKRKNGFCFTSNEPGARLSLRRIAHYDRESDEAIEDFSRRRGGDGELCALFTGMRKKAPSRAGSKRTSTIAAGGGFLHSCRPQTFGGAGGLCRRRNRKLVWRSVSWTPCCRRRNLRHGDAGGRASAAAIQHMAQSDKPCEQQERERSRDRSGT